MLRRKKKVERVNISEVRDVLEDVIMEHPVLLNRVRYRHRLVVQASQPVLVREEAALSNCIHTLQIQCRLGDPMVAICSFPVVAQSSVTLDKLPQQHPGSRWCKTGRRPRHRHGLGAGYLTLSNPAAKGEKVQDFSIT